MKLKYQISLFVIITLLIINSSLATSYSLWIITQSQTGTNLISSGCFEIDYNEVTDSISLDNTYPLTDEVGKKQSPYTVTITNTCTVAADYKFILNELNDNTLTNDKVKYYLTKDNLAEFGPDYYNTLTPYTMDEAIKSGIETDKNVSIKNSYVLATGVLNPEASATYELRLWIPSEVSNDDQDKTFDSIVSFEAYATKIQS